MNRTTIGALTLCAASLCGFAATAQDAGFGLNVGVSTLGVTAEPTWRVNDSFGLRAPIGGGSFSFETDGGDEEYSGDLESSGFGLLGDYRPFGGGLRLSAGAFRTDYRADLSTGEQSFGEVQGRVNATVRQRSNVMPAVAVGYDGSVFNRGVVSMTLGGMFGDGFSVEGSRTVTLPGGQQATTPFTDDGIDDLRDTFQKIKVIPYASVSIGFRF